MYMQSNNCGMFTRILPLTFKQNNNGNRSNKDNPGDFPPSHFSAQKHI
jgi:hypothetical protein